MHWSATKWRLPDFCPFGVWDSLCGTCSGDRDDHDDLGFAGMIMTKKAGWLKCLLILLPVCSVTLCESLTLLDQLSAGVFFCTAVLTHKKPLKHLARWAAGANAFIFSPIILHMLGIPWVSSKQLNIYWVIVLSSFYGTEDVLKLSSWKRHTKSQARWIPVDDDGGGGGGDQRRLESGAKESSQVDLGSATVLALISAAAFVISGQIDI